MGPTWDPPGSCRPQMGPMLAPWTLLSGYIWSVWIVRNVYDMWFLQEDTCLIPSGDITDSTTISTSVNSTLGVVAERLAESRSNTGCDTNVGVQFVIRKILHTISYLYSLYSMRCAEPEQFVSLLERVRFINFPTVIHALFWTWAVRVAAGKGEIH